MKKSFARTIYRRIRNFTKAWLQFLFAETPLNEKLINNLPNLQFAEEPFTTSITEKFTWAFDSIEVSVFILNKNLSHVFRLPVKSDFTIIGQLDKPLKLLKFNDGSERILVLPSQMAAVGRPGKRVLLGNSPFKTLGAVVSGLKNVTNVDVHFSTNQLLPDNSVIGFSLQYESTQRCIFLKHAKVRPPNVMLGTVPQFGASLSFFEDGELRKILNCPANT